MGDASPGQRADIDNGDAGQVEPFGESIEAACGGADIHVCQVMFGRQECLPRAGRGVERPLHDCQIGGSRGTSQSRDRIGSRHGPAIEMAAGPAQDGLRRIVRRKAARRAEEDGRIAYFGQGRHQTPQHRLPADPGLNCPYGESRQMPHCDLEDAARPRAAAGRKKQLTIWPTEQRELRRQAKNRLAN